MVLSSVTSTSKSTKARITLLSTADETTYSVHVTNLAIHHCIGNTNQTRRAMSLLKENTIDAQIRRTIIKSIETYDIGLLKRIAYEVRCEEMGLIPDSTYIEFGISED